MTSTEGDSKLRVAIVGGGTVGLSFALYLNQLDTCDITVYESTKAFSTIGAGIEISHNAMKVYQVMGLADTVYELAAAASGDASNTWFDVWFGTRRIGATPICTVLANTKLHRADALDLLVRRVPGEKVILGKHLESWERTAGGGVVMTFTDGTVAEADVLVGADGIKSVYVANLDQRLVHSQHLARAGVEPKWSGCIAYRGLIPMEKAVSNLGEYYAYRPNLVSSRCLLEHIIQYPVSRGQFVNLIAYVSDFDHGRYPEWDGSPLVEPADTSKMLENFKDYSPPLRNMLAGIENPLKWAIFELPPLPSYASGYVVLIGDAAHAAVPHQGNGASQGIEDAHVLANLLSHPLCTKATVPLALKAYDAVRRPRSQRLQQSSYDVGRLFECVSDAGEDEAKIAEAFATVMEWVWSVDINEQRDRAFRLFEESLSNMAEYAMSV
ncbi:FAD/NAD(P)-binding domain-containing protein [Calocera cornea HHB12733]|uniref:FAD/NAD(P)-binding domain-containing protein n=1 Tax=Calocera cornea HHB12733 TaxID=1353952 RepID=A0A165FLB7_9BASI|nr:FAD/NAD(P)-binding domain-containing protein [Calocera cornea HHB12733]